MSNYLLYLQGSLWRLHRTTKSSLNLAMTGKPQALNMWGRDMSPLDVEVASWAFTGTINFVIHFQKQTLRNFHRKYQFLYLTRTKEKKKAPDTTTTPTSLILWKKQSYKDTLSSPFWKGSLEGICLLYQLDQSNSVSKFVGEGKSCQTFIQFGCFSPSLSIHFVSLGIYLNTS